MAEQYLDISGEWRPANPKLAGSGIVACRPQTGPCPGQCQDCFFMGGRYYEDIEKPHIPDPAWVRKNKLLVRMNDGNDSNHERDLVIEVARMYDRVFFNTRIPRLDFEGLGPVELTANGDDTDETAHCVTDGIENLMGVRFRTNTWNLDLCKRVMSHYLRLGVPVRLTYMAYYQEEVRDLKSYEWRKRTLNSYWVLRPEVRARIEGELGVDQELLHTCTSSKGSLCRDCGKCVEHFKRWWEGV